MQIKNLNKEYIASQELVNDFQNNNEEFTKITRAVGEEVLGVISNVKVLLRYALLSMTESIRNDPERFRSIFNNISSMIDYSSNGQDYMYGQHQYPSPDYGIEANASILVDESEKLFYKLVKDSINKVITDCTFSKSPLPLPNEEELSHISQRSTTANQTYIHKEHTFLQSEIDNKNEGYRRS